MLSRADLALIIGAEFDGWMSGYHTTTHELSAALISGTMSPDIIDAVPATPLYGPTLSESDARTVADAADLPWWSDPGPVRDRFPYGMPFGAEADDITTAVQALRGLVSRDISDGTTGAVWQFGYLSEYAIRTDIDEMRDALAREVHNLTDAARLIVDGMNAYADRRHELHR